MRSRRTTARSNSARSRPSSRRPQTPSPAHARGPPETLETYVKRLERLESIAMEFDGVEKVYAMQAGREVRVMVKPENVDDLQAEVIARDIAKKVEEELQYPGQIRITVIRELRSSALAK